MCESLKFKTVWGYSNLVQYVLKYKFPSIKKLFAYLNPNQTGNLNFHTVVVIVACGQAMTIYCRKISNFIYSYIDINTWE